MPARRAPSRAPRRAPSRVSGATRRGAAASARPGRRALTTSGGSMCEFTLGRRQHLPARLGHPGRRERLALTHAVRAERSRRGRDRMRDAELLGDARRDGGRSGRAPARSRRRARSAAASRSIAGSSSIGDDAAAVGVGESRCARVAVADGAPEPERAGRLEQAELRRACAQHEQARRRLRSVHPRIVTVRGDIGPPLVRTRSGGTRARSRSARAGASPREHLENKMCESDEHSRRGRRMGLGE